MISSKSGKSQNTSHNVIVVGAGAAGIGLGVALLHAGIEDVPIVDRHEVGASFLRWPREMQFITPSFPTNSIGILDLNSIAIGTSPAHSLQVEHPTGHQYAAYLKAVARHFELTVKTGIEVQSLLPDRHGFTLETNCGRLKARYVVWAAGEFQYPQLQPFPGAHMCLHNAEVETWENVPGTEAVVIGGYESGIDAAIHLARLGRKVTVLDRASPWNSDASDPSVSLSTFTLERLREDGVAARVKFVRDADACEVRGRGRGYEVLCASGRGYRTNTTPILATGFCGSVSLISNLFEHARTNTQS